MPLLLALFAVAVAATLGFVAGRLTAPRASTAPTQPPTAAASEKSNERLPNEILSDALAAVAGPAYALVVRIDAVETWRKTHGMKALDQFVQRLERSVRATLPKAVDVRTGDAEVTAICGGKPSDAMTVLEHLKGQTFRLPDGSETFVTCSLGVAAGTKGVDLADLRKRATSAVRGAQAAGRWRAFLADDAGNRPLGDASV